MFLLEAPEQRAHSEAMSDLCTVTRKCSSTGRLCAADDRVCRSDATNQGLEVVCERPEPHAFVYCPAGGQARDSGVVWILLGVAFFVAIVGGGVSFLVLRKKMR
jgi:hypothetical protein